ncbi:MFS transporter [Paenibacillus profundus]|uniref:MFS transporter n=1 Tax=Paenibacillus profundus TaxID=1173085 RepID=A0ABS8YG97_9BACL|nr:MFS transporter [Paenibacillus profundus]MCE5171013.1 MFS transporter [Paenibacillus profundus]
MINRLIWMGCLSYVVTGVTLVIMGAVLPELLAHYGLNYTDGGVLIFVQFIGMLIGVLGMPAVSRRFSRKRGVMLGLLLISVELLLFFLPPWPVVVLLAGLAGAGAGLVESCIGTIILVAVKERQAVAMSKLEVTFGIGALTIPFVASFLIARGIWAYSFLLLGVCALVTVIGWQRLSFGNIDAMLTRTVERGNRETKPTAYTGKGLPFLVLCAAFFMLYGGSEVSVVHFFPSIFIEKWGIASSQATLTVTVYWLAMVIGRALCGVLAEKLTYYRFLWLTTSGSLLVLLLLPFSTQAWGGFAISFLLGLGMAGMFAVMLIYANQALPGMTERTTSILLAANGLGGSLMPIAVGWMMDVWPVQTVLWLFVGVMLTMLLLVFVSRRWQGLTSMTRSTGPISEAGIACEEALYE